MAKQQYVWNRPSPLVRSLPNPSSVGGPPVETKVAQNQIFEPTITEIASFGDLMSPLVQPGQPVPTPPPVANPILDTRVPAPETKPSAEEPPALDSTPDPAADLKLTVDAVRSSRINEVLSRVTTGVWDAKRTLALEKKGSKRKTLLRQLEELL